MAKHAAHTHRERLGRPHRDPNIVARQAIPHAKHNLARHRRRRPFSLIEQPAAVHDAFAALVGQIDNRRTTD
ncbi:hypothetical protein I545_6377 [Mycobacterium kansasii 662]|uniref:Uncharacterized protein n=1 Tax=Mycobacterium kansasii 662 TaxID=1299326 RepID=X7YKX6_MYCKA|nr:hypothetical protein I545_6377 [Mycobacterium kansasii 662]